MTEFKQNPLISIIVVTKNSGKTLKQTLESIKSQTYKNIEVIAIDGNSSDNTVEIFREYSSLLGHLVSEPDGGVYDAMNKGIKAAHGDIVYFLNSNDTFYSDDVCQIVVDMFRKKNALIVFGNIFFKAIDCENVGFRHANTVFKNSRVKNAEKLYRYGICHQSIFYHKEIFQTVGDYDLSFCIHSDLDFNIRAWNYAGERAFYLDKVIANFELGGISTNKKYLEKQQKDIVEIHKKHFYMEPVIRCYSFLGIILFKLKTTHHYCTGYVFGFLPVFKVKRQS